jgi:hypothetical protein
MISDFMKLQGSINKNAPLDTLSQEFFSPDILLSQKVQAHKFYSPVCVKYQIKQFFYLTLLNTWSDNLPVNY